MKIFPPKCLSLLMAASLSLCLVTGAAAQQNLFAPRLVVNDRIITNYEVEQRVQFLRLLRAPGDPEKQALDGLIDDKLRLAAAKALGITATEEQVQTGMTEFAGRANLSAEEFIQAIGEGGIAPETFRNFVEAGIVWREVVRAKFGSYARPTETAIDRAISNETRTAAVRVLLSELIIPAPPGEEADALALATRLKTEIRSEAAFASAARTYSAAPSAERGGRIEWLPLENLPASLSSVVLALGAGEVSDPVPIPNAVALFQVRAIEETDRPAPDGVEVEYAELFLPETGDVLTRAAELTERTDDCDDLYSVVDESSPDQLRRETRAMAEVPQDVALELARLDAGETSVALRRGEARLFLMLCARRPITESPIDRGDVGARLVNQRLGALADGYLADLRANAIIREP